MHTRPTRYRLYRREAGVARSCTSTGAKRCLGIRYACAAPVRSTLEVAPDQPAQEGGRELSLDCRFDPQQRALIYAEHPTVADR